MQQLETLLDHIANRVSSNLCAIAVDVKPYIDNLVPRTSHTLYYALYALTERHPAYFSFKNSSLSGTYFLGKCCVNHSVLYKANIRGDELKTRGTRLRHGDYEIVLQEDEVITISHSFLVKTLIHAHSHDPEYPESFSISNTVALPYSNIHGTRTEGCFIDCFATVDLSMCHDCAIGAFAYVQAGDMFHQRIEPGRIWVKKADLFEFDYTHPKEVINQYISMDETCRPQGEFISFFKERQDDFAALYATVGPDSPYDTPLHSYISPYAVIKGKNQIGENVLIAQSACIENSVLGTGSNAQEHCYIINSHYAGLNVTAHGGRVIHCSLGQKTFTGFNSFLRGSEQCPVTVGSHCIIMPHTLIDATQAIEIPDKHLVWGYIRTQQDLETQTLSLDKLMQVSESIRCGTMTFTGSGRAFVEGFQARIDHILEENGAYYDAADESHAGHAQKTQETTYSVLQPYTSGIREGMSPPVTIGPEESAGCSS